MLQYPRYIRRHISYSEHVKPFHFLCIMVLHLVILHFVTQLFSPTFNFQVTFATSFSRVSIHQHFFLSFFLRSETYLRAPWGSFASLH